MYSYFRSFFNPYHTVLLSLWFSFTFCPWLYLLFSPSWWPLANNKQHIISEWLFIIPQVGRLRHCFMHVIDTDRKKFLWCWTKQINHHFWDWHVVQKSHYREQYNDCLSIRCVTMKNRNLEKNNHWLELNYRFIHLLSGFFFLIQQWFWIYFSRLYNGT